MKGVVWPTPPWCLALVTILGATLAIGCLPDDPSRNTIANLDGRLVTDRPIVVAPNRHWLPRPEDGAWG
jgi:hypothetical protein